MRKKITLLMFYMSFGLGGYAQVFNGSFELGLSGWSVMGAVSSETGAFGVAPIDGGQQAYLSAGASFTATQIESFVGIAAGGLAALGNGTPTVGSAMSQTFSLNAGDKITFYWNFLSAEGLNSPYNDFAFVCFTPVSPNPATIANTQTAGLGEPFVLYFLQTGYRFYTYTAPTTASYKLSFGVMNVLDQVGPSGVLIDEVYVCRTTNVAPVATSSPFTLTLNEDAPLQSLNLYNYFNDANGDILEFEILSNSNPVLFSNIGITGTNGNFLGLSLTPNAFGTANVQVRASDKCKTNTTRTCLITVNPVNDPPRFQKGADITVLEDAPAFSQSWATNIAAGPPNEASQSLAFSVSVPPSQAFLFAIPPSITPTGVLSFVVAPNRSGAATLTVTLQDNGGTAFGGIDQASTTFNLTVKPVNDPPSFTAGIDISVNEEAPGAVEAPAQSLPWASNISPGAFEGEQSVNFLTEVIQQSSTMSFASGKSPAISPTGLLTFTPATNAYGTARIKVILRDNGGTADGGIDSSDPIEFLITVNPVNDPPTLNPITPQTIEIVPNAPQQTINLTGISAGINESQHITITARSSDPTLIPNPSIVYTSPNNTATLNFAPVVGQVNRSAKITVLVKDDGGIANGGIDSIRREFTVVVKPINVAPTINTIPNQKRVKNTGSFTVQMSGITAGGGQSGQQINITAASSNPAGIPNPTVNYVSPNSTGALVINPLPDFVGVVTVTLTLQDNGGTANGGVDTFVTTFTVEMLNDFPNQPPTLNPIDDVVITNPSPNANVEVNLTGITAGGTDNNQLTITAVSSNPNLIPNPTVQYTSPQTTGKLILQVAALSAGNAIITVTVRDNGGTEAGSVDAITRTFRVSIEAVTGEEDAFGQGITLYPNPARDRVQLKTALPYELALSYRLLDTAGRSLAEGEIAEGNTESIIDLEGLAVGLYLLELRRGKQYIIKRIVKQ